MKAAALFLAIAAVSLLAVIAHNGLSPTAWEYAVESPSDQELETKLAEMGQAGWEISSARRALHDSSGVYEIIFKRPVAFWGRKSSPASGERSEASSLSSSPQHAPAIRYPAPDDPLAQKVLRACVEGGAVALQDGEWVPFSIGGTPIRCVVDR